MKYLSLFLVFGFAKLAAADSISCSSADQTVHFQMKNYLLGMPPSQGTAIGERSLDYKGKNVFKEVMLYQVDSEISDPTLDMHSETYKELDESIVQGMRVSTYSIKLEIRGKVEFCDFVICKKSSPLNYPPL